MDDNLKTYQVSVHLDIRLEASTHIEALSLAEELLLEQGYFGGKRGWECPISRIWSVDAYCEEGE